MVVHPEVGKWLIALGEKAFGMDPFGWRVAAAVVGALMVLVMCRLVRRVTGSTLLGCVAGLLLGFDGLHLVLSRLALLDIFLAFFILCAVHCLVADRDWFRRRLAATAASTPAAGWRAPAWGPVRGLLFRPWLLAGGVCFGLAVGTKWTALYPLAAFGLLVWAWSAAPGGPSGCRWPLLRSALVDGVPAFVHLVGVGLVVYVATWTGWLVHAEEYEELRSETAVHARTTAAQQWPTATEPDADGPRRGGAVAAVALRTTTRTSTSSTPTSSTTPTHPYASKPAGLAAAEPARRRRRPERHPARRAGLRRPRGQRLPAPGAAARQPGDLVGRLPRAGRGGWCIGSARATGASASPWSASPSTWLPWLLYDDRPIFIFYAIATLPFLVLALTLALGQHGRPRPRARRRGARSAWSSPARSSCW